MKRARSRWVCAAALTGAVLWPIASFAQENGPGPDLGLVGRLPDTCDLVIAAGSARELRETPAGRAFERFFQGVSPWEKSVKAWSEVATSLGLEPSAAADEVGGAQITFAIEGFSDAQPTRQPRHAMIGEISAAMDERLRERLEVSARGLQSGISIMTLEQGAFDLSTWLPKGAERGRVLISPRDSEAFFDRVLPVLAGKAGESPLATAPAWTALRGLPRGRVAALYRDVVAEPGEEREAGKEPYFVMTADATGDELRAHFRASTAMFYAGEGAGELAWPTGAVDALATDAVLLVAGSPHEQPGPMDLAIPAGEADRTLLLTLLAMMQLPPALHEEINGVAVIAVHTGAEPGQVSVSAAIPLENILDLIPEADRWGAGLAGDPRLKLDEKEAAASVRALSIMGGRPGVLGGLVKQGGSIAWNYVLSPEGTGGWWAISLRTGAPNPPAAMAAVTELSARLAAPAGKPDPTSFRLALRPTELLTLTRGGKGAASMTAFRWITSIDTTVRRGAEAGEIEGEITVGMNTGLLKARPERETR